MGVIGQQGRTAGGVLASDDPVVAPNAHATAESKPKLRRFAHQLGVDIAPSESGGGLGEGGAIGGHGHNHRAIGGIGKPNLGHHLLPQQFR